MTDPVLGKYPRSYGILEHGWCIAGFHHHEEKIVVLLVNGDDHLVGSIDPRDLASMISDEILIETLPNGTCCEVFVKVSREAR